MLNSQMSGPAASHAPQFHGETLRRENSVRQRQSSLLEALSLAGECLFGVDDQGPPIRERRERKWHRHDETAVGAQRSTELSQQ